MVNAGIDHAQESEAFFECWDPYESLGLIRLKYTDPRVLRGLDASFKEWYGMAFDMDASPDIGEFAEWLEQKYDGVLHAERIYVHRINT